MTTATADGDAMVAEKPVLKPAGGADSQPIEPKAIAPEPKPMPRTISKAGRKALAAVHLEPSERLAPVGVEQTPGTTAATAGPCLTSAPVEPSLAATSAKLTDEKLTKRAADATAIRSAASTAVSADAVGDQPRRAAAAAEPASGQPTGAGVGSDGSSYAVNQPRFGIAVPNRIFVGGIPNDVRDFRRLQSYLHLLERRC